VTKARTRAADVTTFNQPLPLCEQCLENRLTRQDLSVGCVRCKTCRQQGPAPTLNPDKPVNLESWWIVGQSREHQDRWFARARRELDRMTGSTEARKLGFRPAVEELGRRVRES
jgi:ribosomal protein L37AE/L43A